MKSIYIFFLTIYFNYAISLEVKCQFEEVYADGTHQQGIFFFDNNRLRYQYLNNQLYTLIYSNYELVAVQNNNISAYQLVRDNHNIIKFLKNISRDYPNFKNEYKLDNQEVLIEINSKKNFIKRLTFKSENLNFSLYFNDCKFDKIDQKLFSYEEFLKD